MLRYLRALVEANRWAGERPQEAAAALTRARYADHAAQRLVRGAVPGLEVAQSGWDEVVALRRESGLMPNPEPKAAEIVNRALLAQV
jgi:hypothetical protein